MSSSKSRIVIPKASANRDALIESRVRTPACFFTARVKKTSPRLGAFGMRGGSAKREPTSIAPLRTHSGHGLLFKIAK